MAKKFRHIKMERARRHRPQIADRFGTYGCKKITIHPIHPGQGGFDGKNESPFPSDDTKTSCLPDDPMTRSLLFSTLVQTWLERNQCEQKKREEGFKAKQKHCM